MHALVAALSQGPPEQRFQQGSAPVEGLKVHQKHPRQTKLTTVPAFKDRVCSQATVIHDGSDREPIFEQSIFKVPLQHCARADSQEYVRILSLQLRPELIKAIIESLNRFHFHVAGTQTLGRKSVPEKSRSGNRIAQKLGQSL